MWSTSPPRKKSARTTSIVAPAVRIVRDSVWLIDRLMNVSRGSFFGVFWFSRIAVVDDDGVVHRVADERQQRRDHDEVELAAEEREQARRDQRVVDQGDDGADAEGQRPEPEGDVGEHADRGPDDRQEGLLLKVGADLRADVLGREEHERARVRVRPGARP